MIFKFFVCLLVLIGGSLAIEAKTTVLVSIAPQKFLVEKIGGETVSVEVIVPSSFSPHSYEPTMSQLIALKKGEIWFRIGESFEKKLLPLIQKNLVVIDPRASDCDALDPHIWLNPLLLKTHAEQIARTLSTHNPDHALFYQSNLTSLLEELNLVDREISELLAPRNQEIILVSHPSFGYFCQRYDLKQLPIEMEGKEPSPKYITNLLLLAQSHNIAYVYIQPQYSTKGGEWIARALGAEIVSLDPYAENVIESLKTIAQAFSAL